MLWSALIHVGKWKDQNKPQQSLSLFFEQGYSTQSRANELLQYAIQDKALRRGGPGIISHSFFDKDCSYPGQAADLLAWNVRKGNANVYAGKPLRGDTRALIEGRITKTVFFDRKRLTLLSEDFVKKCGSLAVASRQLFTRNPAASEGLERYS